MKKFWDTFKSGVLAFGVMVYHWLLVKINRQNLELKDKDLKNELLKNKHKTDLDTRSSRDVVRDAINRGRNNSGKKSDPD